MKPKRHETAKEILTIAWEYPSWDPNQRAFEETPAEQSGQSTAAFVRAALPVAKAIDEINGEDRRPLLVLRECMTCSGTDDALLSKTEDNERTILLSHWFRCVKLPPDVLDDDHPFTKLFGTNDPPHLFVASWDGTGQIDLKGDQSRSELWAAMEAKLKTEYKADAKRRVRDFFKLLDQYDELDQEIALLENKVDQLLETDGPDSRKMKKVQKKLEKAREELADLKEKETKLRDLGLKDTAPQPAAAEATAQAAQ